MGGDVEDAAGPLQLCAGQDRGCEAAVHAMRNIFQDSETEAVLVVDVNNAFNSLNCKGALHNISIIICPSIAQILINTYRGPVTQFVTGSGEIFSMEGTTQGDPLAMAMYTLAVTPLIDQLKASCPEVRQVWYADDATGASTVRGHRLWWKELADCGPYNPNASKTYLIVKQEHVELAKTQFVDTDVAITTYGKCHLGAALGSKTFTEKYVNNKVQKWTADIINLAGVATTQPHAAYAAYIHGLSNRWLYLLRTVPDISDLLQPLEIAIHQHLIPALTGHPPCSSIERALLALPTCLGGLGIHNPSAMSSESFQSSEKITAPLVALIISQDPANTTDPNTMVTLKSDTKKRNCQLQCEQAQAIYDQLSPDLQRCMELSSEKGSSSWLSVLPLEEHGFYLHKGEFRDALCLRYGWRPTNMPQLCNCGTQFTVDHAMICHMGGFPMIRHNKIRDITASLLTEVCHNVATEPALQPLTGERMNARTANSNEGACLDIRARGFWNRAQDAFLM